MNIDYAKLKGKLSFLEAAQKNVQKFSRNDINNEALNGRYCKALTKSAKAHLLDKSKKNEALGDPKIVGLFK